MSKGRNLTKRKWGDFRKSHKPQFKRKFYRNTKIFKNFEGYSLSMKAFLYILPDYFK